LAEEKTAKSWLKEMQKGHIRLAVLTLLNKQSLHGYRIMKEIENKTLGFWKPTAGGVYPILRKLERKGYIRGAWIAQGKGRKRKIYHITDEGKRVLEHAVMRHSQITQSMNKLFEEFARDVLEVQSVPVPSKPDFFAILMEEVKTSEEKASLLKKRRARLEDMAKQIRRQIEAISEQLNKIGAA